MTNTIKSLSARITRKLEKYRRRLEATNEASYAAAVEPTEKNENKYNKAHDAEVAVEKEIRELYLMWLEVSTDDAWDELVEEYIDLFGYEVFGQYIEKAEAEVEVEVKAVKAPKPGTVSAKVWEIASANADKARKEVIALCIEAGVNPATAKTQYQRWFSAQA